LVSNLLSESVDSFITEGLVSSVLFVSLGLGFNDVGEDLVNNDNNVVHWGLVGNAQSDGTDDCVSEWVLV
jgi:hypothetical protein